MSVTDFSCVLTSAEETEVLAEKIAGFCKVGDILLLYGDLGVGKTTFARSFIQSLAATKEEIVSPTFTLVQTYPLRKGGEVWHCDLYRLKNEAELIELGLEEAFGQNIMLIEWPEIAENYLPAGRLEIKLEMAGTGRRVTVSGNDEIVGKISKI